MIFDLSIVSAVLSNLVSNVPAVLLISPALLKLNNVDNLWLALAMSSTEGFKKKNPVTEATGLVLTKGLGVNLLLATPET